MNSATQIGRLTEPEAPDAELDLAGSAPDPLTIGRRVRHVRQEAGRTLGDVADAIGISPSALSLIETGKREPRLSVLAALAKVLDASVQDFLSSAPPSRRPVTSSISAKTSLCSSECSRTASPMSRAR